MRVESFLKRLRYRTNQSPCEDLGDERFLAQRKADAEPILADFKSWILKRKDEVPPTRLLRIAVNYTLGQWDKLAAYLESPYLTPDNNTCENAI